MSPTYVCVATDANGSHRLTFRSNVFSLEELAASSSVRTSRIFPVIAARDLPSQNDQEKFWIALLTTPNAHVVAGNLAPESQEILWFSLGLASLIAISSDQKRIQQIIKELEPVSISVELWEINDECLSSEIVKHPSQQLELKITDFQIPSSELITDNDIISHLRELNHNLAEAAYKASIFNVTLLPTLQGITQYAAEIASEIEYLINPSGNSETISEAEEAELSGNSDLRHRRLNQNLDYIITINSSLAYLTSQAFHGCCPILTSNDCLIRHHSLFGVGTAHTAIQKIICYVERLFERHPVTAAVDYLHSVKLTGSILNSVPLSNLQQPRLDDFIEENNLLKTPVELSPKLASFSGRLGFGESAGTVTCAPETLHASDSVRWSLITLTHELMHSHVEALLISLFQTSRVTELSEVQFKALAEQHIAAFSDKGVQPTALEAVRGRLLWLLNDYETALEETPDLDKITTSQAVRIPILMPDTPEPILRDLLSAYHVLNEVMVHVLDLEYFYLGNKSRYIDSLWLSWATVPGVAESLEFYILRTLASVGATEIGNIAEDRFTASTNLLKESFKRIKDHAECRSLIETAERFLDDTVFQSRIRLLFEPCCLIAELTIHFLFSEKVRITLESDDDLLTGSGEEKIYLMQLMEVAGAQVSNPIAFIYDRLRRNLSNLDRNPIDDYDEEHRSAWIYFALAATKTS